MLDSPWDLVFLAGFVVYVGIRGVFEGRARGQEIVERRRDRVETGILALVFLGSLLLPVLYLFTPWLGFADYTLPWLVPWCGAAIMVSALWLFWRSHADLGVNWSVTLEIRAGHELITRGVYRRVRHPMYAAIWLFSLAQGLLLANWLAGWSALVAFGALYAVRVPREERMLLATFGESWRTYCATTGRLIPTWRRRGPA